MLAQKHFSVPNHNFQQYPEFTLSEQIKKQKKTEKTRKLLNKHENSGF